MTKSVSAIPAMMTSTEVGKLIEAAHKGVFDSMQALHKAAVQCLLHASPPVMDKGKRTSGGYGDTGLLFRLIDGLNMDVKGETKRHAYVTGLTRWATFHAPVRFTTKGAKYDKWQADDTEVIGGKAKEGDYKRAWKIEDACITPFWTFQPQGDLKNMDTAAVVNLVEAGFKRAARIIAGESETVAFAGNEAQAARIRSAMEAALKTFKSRIGADAETKVNADLDDANSKRAIKAANTRHEDANVKPLNARRRAAA